MDFSIGPKAEKLQARIADFMDRYVFPAEQPVLDEMGHSGTKEPPILKEIRAKAKAEGLWNLFMPDDKYGAGLNHWSAP